MDYLSELEIELAEFTEKLLDGIGAIQNKDFASPDERTKAISMISSALASAHTKVVSTISRIPEDLFKCTKEHEEDEIKQLQDKHTQVTARLKLVQEKAVEIRDQLESCLDSL